MAETLPEPRAFAPFEWLIAMRYLRAKRKDGFISLISIFSFAGIVLGVATLITVMAVMNGFRVDLLDKILGFSGHATVLAVDRNPILNFEAVSQKLTEVPDVTLAMPFVEGQALASSTRSNTGILIRGIREADMKKLKSINNERLMTAIKEPGTPDEVTSLDGFDKSEGIAVGRALADNHLLGLGSTLTVLSPQGAETIMGNVPRVRDFVVTAIFEMGMYKFDETIVYMPLADAQEFFDKEEGVAAIELMVKNPDQIRYMLPALQAATGDKFRFDTWEGKNKEFFAALTVERNVMFMILSMIILVAAFNIISSMIMLVKDKSHDIAILRTMGTTRPAVMRIFMMTGSSIGVAGTIGGVILGIIVAMNVRYLARFVSYVTGVDVFDPTVRFLSELPSEIDVGQTAWVAAMALVLSVLATLYPSWRAARLDPVEALRYE